MINLSKIQKIHIIGIGGIGVSALAQLFLSQGKSISGSDMEDCDLLCQLKKEGIKVTVGHSEDNLSSDIDLVIISPAIPEDNSELKKAKSLKIPILTYPEALGLLSKDYYTIAICGTHGKTTTTALTALVLEELDPTVVIGTKVREFGNKNVRIGKNKFFVLEACEYKRAFLNIDPDILLITNIEAEHLDYYKDLDDYKSAFKEFCKKVPKNGYIIANFDDKNVRDVVKGACASVVKFGSEVSDFKLINDIVFEKNKEIGQLNLQIPGDHNLQNALAAFAVGRVLDLQAGKIILTLNEYQGSWRRFEFKGYFNGAEIYDDYAHHPTEIKVTLKAARFKFPDRRIVCIFQPHQYSRTKKLLKEFSKAFADADLVIIPNIYRVRDSEKDINSISAEDLVKKIQKHHQNVIFGDGFSETVKFLQKNIEKNDVVFTMGAGDVWRIGKKLMQQ